MKSGAEIRRNRVARGEPRYTEKDLAGRRAYRKTRKANYRARLAKIKTERGCTDCGYNAHYAALEFDHLPGFEKVADLGVMVNRGCSWGQIERETQKCEVVCANCHRVRTAERSGAGASV